MPSVLVLSSLGGWASLHRRGHVIDVLSRRHAGASRAAVITYINPVVAALLGVTLLHERLGAETACIVLILSGSWLATRAPARDLGGTPVEERGMAGAVVCPAAGARRCVVIGAGYTGLSAARETAAAGDPLWCSTRALGRRMFEPQRRTGCVQYKAVIQVLERATRRGPGVQICREGMDAVAYLRSLSTQHIDCDWREQGVFRRAHAAAFRLMPRTHGISPAAWSRDQHRSESRKAREIDSEFYHGGASIMTTRRSIPRACCWPCIGAPWTAAPPWWSAAPRVRSIHRAMGSRCRHRAASCTRASIARDQRILGACLPGIGDVSSRSAAIKLRPNSGTERVRALIPQGRTSSIRGGGGLPATVGRW